MYGDHIYTKEELLNLPAGREKDIAIAKLLLKCYEHETFVEVPGASKLQKKTLRVTLLGEWLHPENEIPPEEKVHINKYKELPHFTTDLGSAFLLLEKLVEAGWSVDIHRSARQSIYLLTAINKDNILNRIIESGENLVEVITKTVINLL